MRTTNKLDRSTKLLLLLGFSGLVASLFAFSFIKNSSQKSLADRPKIATVSNPSQDVRLKRYGDIHWYPVSGVVECFSGDLLFTGVDSTAIVTFQSGDKISLYPHSLISLTEQSLSLEMGNIELEMKGKESFVLDGIEGKIKFTDEGKVRVDGNQKEIVILKDPKKSMSKNHALTQHIKDSTTKPKKPLAVVGRTEEIIRLLNPINNFLIEVSNPLHEPILFSWLSSYQGKFIVQIGRDVSFNELVLDERTAFTETRFKLKEPGLYFWRVGFQNNEKIKWSDIASFKFSEKKYLSLILTNIPSVMDFALMKEHKILVKDPEEWTDLQLIIYKDNKKINTIEFQNEEFTVSKMLDGQYIVRAKGNHNGTVMESKDYPIEIRTSLPVKAPMLNKKSIQVFI